jgi:hypothetical protein
MYSRIESNDTSAYHHHLVGSTDKSAMIRHSIIILWVRHSCRLAQGVALLSSSSIVKTASPKNDMHFGMLSQWDVDQRTPIGSHARPFNTARTNVKVAWKSSIRTLDNNKRTDVGRKTPEKVMVVYFGTLTCPLPKYLRLLLSIVLMNLIYIYIRALPDAWKTHLKDSVKVRRFSSPQWIRPAFAMDAEVGA